MSTNINILCLQNGVIIKSNIFSAIILYIDNLSKIHEYKINLLNNRLCYNLFDCHIHMISYIEKEIPNCIYKVSNKRLIYESILKFKNYNIHFINFYYIYIIRMFSIKNWKKYYIYQVNINFQGHIQFYKNFNTMCNYKCVIFM